MTCTSKFFHAFFHVGHPVSCVCPIAGGGGRHPFAIVLNLEEKESHFRGQGDADFGCAGIFDDVVEGFLESEEKIVPELGGKFAFGKVDGKIEPAANVGHAEKFLGVGAEIVGEVIEVIVLRADGPDDAVHGAHEVAGG